MRKIKRIFVHCTAGSQRQTIDDLKAEFHRKGWSTVTFGGQTARNGRSIVLVLMPCLNIRI